METSMAIWSARVAEVRESTQNLNNLIISLGYTRKFLDFVVNGKRKPGIVDLMDNSSLGQELKKAQKKNWDTVQKLTDSMVNEYQGEAEKLFALEG
jgi:3-methyladenine DNA glycosylase AlkD